jgi:cytoskeleton protein RodZ
MTELGDADAGKSVGEELARARETLGLSLADVAQQLKFATRQIEALEQGRFDELPTGTFARGMVRAYARLLRLDPEPLVERIAGRVAVPDNAAAVATVRRRIPITDSSRRSNLIYAVLSLAILGGIAAMAIEWQRESSNAARMTFVPAAAPNGQPVPQPTAQAPVEPQRTEVASAAVKSGLAPQTRFEPTATAAPVAAPAERKEGTRRITLKFERDSWVEIRGRDGKTLLSKLNASGSEETVEGRPPFALIIGNAHHVRLSYDDQPIDLAPHVKVEVARFTLD